MNIPENFDRWMFDYMEGNLSPGEAEAFEGFLLKNPEFEPEADAWENAKIPAGNVAYPNQQSLERKRKVAGWYGWSAAATLTLLIAFGGLWMMKTDSKNATNTTNATKTLQFTKAAALEYGAGELSVKELMMKGNEEERNQPEGRRTFLNGNNPVALFSRNTNRDDRNSGFNTGSNAVNATQSVVNNLSDQHENQYNGVQNSADHDANAYTGITTIAGPGNYESVSKAIKQVQQKFNAGKHAAQYANNPAELAMDLDLSKKSTVNFNSFGNRTKRLYRKIEKMFGYPVGLVNLRDPELILPENNLVGSNPAFAGGMLKPRFEMAYRNQWSGSEMNGHKMRISYDNYVPELKGGIGIALNTEMLGAGAFGDYSMDITYSPKISVGKHSVIEPGVKVSIGGIVADAPKLHGTESFEIERGMVLSNEFTIGDNQTEMLWYQDYGVGLVLNTKWFYAGVSADNLGCHYANVYRTEDEAEPLRTPVLYNGIIGADYESRDKNMTFSPFISVRQFGERSEAWGGMNFRLNHFTIGGAYSTQNDYTASIGIKLKRFKLVYQYDRTQNLVLQKQLDSHNIGIRFNGK